ncbi:MAG TPA: transketolase C-terminal domain-containing protein [Actinomycetota bacterium]|nr:transketolase C-terminal domain-containing protein [Actinomycetota bacterium]
MRGSFIRTLVEIAREDPKVVLLTGDLGFTVVEPFAEEFPDRFYNVGVAEQNMVGLATGMAEAGYIPFVYSIVTFASLRTYEFVRNGPIAHQLPVRIVGIGGGFDYGTAGLTHYGLEDLGVMRIQPGITVVVPADQAQAAAALRSTYNLAGPVYYRIGKDDGRILAGLGGSFRLGRTERVREGKDLTLIAAGSMACDCAAAAEKLAELGIEAQVLVVSSLNPAPSKDLVEALTGVPVALTVEAHYVNGALGSLAAETIAENGLGCRLSRCGVTETPHGLVGGSAYMSGRFGLSADGVVQSALRALEEAAPAAR